MAQAGVFALLAATFVLKLVVLRQLKDHPLTQPEAGLDTTAYVDLARQVLAGNLALGPGLYYVSPLYIYFLAALLAPFHSFTFVRVAQVLLGTASVGFIFFSARAWYGARAAWLAAILAGLTGLFTFYEVLILQSSIDAFLASAALYALTRALRVRPFDLRWLFGAGLIFGVQTLNRPNVFIAAAGVTIVLLGVTRRMRPAALLVAGLLAGMAPVALRNIVVAHQWSLVSSHGGLNFYIGNSERATGFYTNVPGITPTIAGQERDARRVAERALGRPLGDAETSAYFFDLAWQWISAHPVAALALFARKFYYVFNAQHVALPHSYPFYAYDARTLLRFLFVGPWLIVPLGLAGLVFGRPPSADRGYLVWAAFVPAYAAAVAVFFVAERYRLPLLVPLCVASGAALDHLGSGLQNALRRGSGLESAPTRGAALPATRQQSRAGTRKRRFADLTPIVAAAGVFGVLANWPLHVSDGRWEEGLRMAQRLVILHRYDEADRWTARLEGHGAPHAGAAHFGVGAQLLLENETARALPHLQAAHAADPSEPRIEYTLGQALLKSGRPADAIPHLRRGFEAGVEIPGGGYDLAIALQAIGDLGSAADVVSRVRLGDSDDVEAWLRLGRIAQEAREPAIAEPYFRHAAAIRPDVGAARQQFGLNLLVLGRLADAERELREAVRLEPRNPDSLAALALCEMRMGRVEDARAHAAAALAINPDDPLARGILRGGGS